jgi:hypothetical protein
MSTAWQAIHQFASPANMDGPQFLGLYLVLWLALILLTQITKLAKRKLSFKLSRPTWESLIIAPYMLLIVFGAFRIVHGLMIDKPVGYLVMLVLATAVNLFLVISR